jgi:hypothetical protein
MYTDRVFLRQDRIDPLPVPNCMYVHAFRLCQQRYQYQVYPHLLSSVTLKLSTGRYISSKTVVFLESGNDITTKQQIYDDAITCHKCGFRRRRD